MSFPKVKTPIKCENCGYEWKYKGKLRRTTCPNCGNKTPTTKTEETLESLLENPQPDEDTTSKMLKEYLET